MRKFNQKFAIFLGLFAKYMDLYIEKHRKVWYNDSSIENDSDESTENQASGYAFEFIHNKKDIDS